MPKNVYSNVQDRSVCDGRHINHSNQLYKICFEESKLLNLSEQKKHKMVNDIITTHYFPMQWF